MNEYLNNFTTYLSLTKGASPRTVESYKRELQRFFSVCDVTHPRKITAQKVDALRVYLANRPKPVKKDTVKHYLIALRKFLEYLKRQGIETLDFTLIELPKTGKRLPKIRTREQMEKILAEAKIADALAYAAMMTIYSTGLRISELAALPKSLNLDADNGYMVKGKGDKDRIVYFTASALEALRVYLSQRTEETDPRLFPIAVGNISARIRRAVRRAGLSGQNIGAHAFRHLCATELYRNSKDLIALQEYLGHSSLDTTKIYAHIVNEDKKKMHSLLPSIA